MIAYLCSRFQILSDIAMQFAFLVNFVCFFKGKGSKTTERYQVNARVVVRKIDNLRSVKKNACILMLAILKIIRYWDTDCIFRYSKKVMQTDQKQLRYIKFMFG